MWWSLKTGNPQEWLVYMVGLFAKNDEYWIIWGYTILRKYHVLLERELDGFFRGGIDGCMKQKKSWNLTWMMVAG